MAGPKKTEHRVDGRHPGSKHVSALSAFQFRNGALKRLTIRMLGARIVEAFILAQFGLHVRRSLIDRRDNGARSGIRLLSHVNRVGSETHNALLQAVTAER